MKFCGYLDNLLPFPVLRRGKSFREGVSDSALGENAVPPDSLHLLGKLEKKLENWSIETQRKSRSSES